GGDTSAGGTGGDTSAGGTGGTDGEEEDPCEEAELELVGTAVAPNTADTTTTVIDVPDTVAPGDLAVVILLATGVTPPTVTQAPEGFVTANLAAGNHRVSYGIVGSEETL